MPNTLFAYKYEPPVWGYIDASWADEEAFANARVLANSNPKIVEYELIFEVGAKL